MADKFKCACCGFHTLIHQEPLFFEVCPVCYWENDPIQNDDSDYTGAANQISLNEAIKNYKIFGACQEKYSNLVREPHLDEL